MRDRLDAILPALPGELPRRGALLDAVAALSVPAPAAEPPSAGEVPALVRALAAAGLLTECVRSDAAAPPISLRALCILRAALAYRSPLLDLLLVMQGLGSYAVSLAGSPAQRAAYLPQVASGQAIAALALTEPEAGSDLAGIRTAARALPGGGYALDGEKVYISNAGVATHYVLYARTAEHPKKGLTAFLLPATAPGLTVTPLRMLCDDHPIGRLVLRDVRLPEDARIGAEGQGMTLALETLAFFRPSVGAAAVGMARRALDESIAHVRRRQQFGQPLAALQATQLALAEMATECDAAALLVQRAALHADAGPDARGPSALPSATAKLYATEAAGRIVDRALQLHGGSGLLAGSVIERLYRDVRALRIYEGTSEIQKLIIARELLRAEPGGR